MRGQAEVSIIPGCELVFNDAEVVEKMVSIAKNTLGKEMVHEISAPVMGGEDFSAFLKKA
jgi:metal-dependent amidase/aminoacylase/carboxypeptidase family protein